MQIMRYKIYYKSLKYVQYKHNFVIHALQVIKILIFVNDTAISIKLTLKLY
jgi:hypothetical protein